VSQSVEPEAAFRFRIPFRCHMRLKGRSPLTKLIRYGSYVQPPEHFIAKLHNEINELALRNLELLPLETLEIESGGRTLEATVDMRNTQFIGADREAGEFANGYEPDILALIDMFVDRDGAFIDVGANWGYMALHCLLRPGFHGRIIAIEPGARARHDLQKLLRDCRFEHRVEVLAYAIGDAHGPIRLTRPPWSGMATTIGAAEGDLVEMRRFDELAMPSASLIKVDIEGSEAAFVRGARDYLRRSRSPIVFENRTDTPGGDWETPYALLAELRYECFAVLAEVKGAAPEQSFTEVTLHPAGPANRAAFPVHLNVLAVADRRPLAGSRFAV